MQPLSTSAVAGLSPGAGGVSVHCPLRGVDHTPRAGLRSAGALQRLGRVDVDPRAEVADLDRVRADALEDVAGADVAFERCDVVEVRAAERDRVPGRAVEGAASARVRAVLAGEVGEPGDDLRRDLRHVAERQHDGLRPVADRRDPAAQRRGLTGRPVLADDDLGRPEVDARADLLRTGAQDDDDPLDRGHRLDRADRVLEQRDAVQLGELLRRAEPRRPARREHDGGDHAPPPVAGRAGAITRRTPRSLWLSRSRAVRRRRQRAQRQDAREVALVVRRGVEVARRLRALGRERRGRRDVLAVQRLAAQRAPSVAVARSGVEAMCVSPTRTSSQVPSAAFLTSAQTPTIAQSSARRLNFS